MTRTDWRLRLARAADAPGMAEVEPDAASLFDSYEPFADFVLPPARNEDCYRKLIGRGHCLVATSEDTLVGFAAARPYGRELHLHELSVRRAFQNGGLGGTLLQAVAIDAINSGFRAITLCTFREVPWNAPFYRERGFVEVDDLDAHPRLRASMDEAVAAGLPREMRVAMIRFLNLS